MVNYKDEPSDRSILPPRRLAENRRIVIPSGQTVHLSIGFDPNEPSRPREVFYSGGFLSGADLEFIFQDACVLISLLLQHGHEPLDIGKSLARHEGANGELEHGSIVGLIVEALSNEQAA